MGELIERHMESMTEEINEMRRTKLFSIEETRLIMKKRKHFECKINGAMKNIQDFKDYIQYEKVILKDIKLRRNKLRIADRKSSIEFKILKRIKYLYEIATQRFSNDFNLCLMYFKFCKESNYNQAASLVIQNMIKHFAHIPEMWKVAAAWHVKKDVNQALSVILKGLTIHQTSETLFSEAIQLELMNRGKDDWTDGSQNKDQLCCQKIQTYVDSIMKNIRSHQFLIKILELLNPYGFTKSVQDKIVKNLMERYPEEADVWHALAQRERNGDHYDEVPGSMHTSNTKFRLDRCFKKYQEGFVMTKSCPDQHRELWSLYLEFLVDLQLHNDNSDMIRNTLLNALRDANDCQMLTERYFVVWVKLLKEETDILDVTEKGLKAIPKSVELWKLKLKYAVIKDNVKNFNQTFKKGVMQLQNKSTPLWMMALRYHILTSSSAVIENIFMSGVQQAEEVGRKMKCEYIQWLVLNKGITEARRKYNDLARTPPFCKELHTIMANLESQELDVNAQELEKVLRLACDQFGGEDSDVWIGLIRCYFEHHKAFESVNSKFDVNELTSRVFREAESKIGHNGPLLADFLGKYDVLKTTEF
ncbi:unnamed protein product [Phaedon cochleariae]|uniref:U3 small nucleolar RNA-associated protein 6 homolog n=1 Tax=Phaedon cochleariae TaxID=80249 RepID=A0A9P0DQE9_PHACE|nr:unnamed protein product [Phaedon cochleariae]